MLRAEQTPDKEHLEKQGKKYTLVDWHLDILHKYTDRLIGLTRYIGCMVFKGWFRQWNLSAGIPCHQSAAWWCRLVVFAWQCRTGKSGRPRIKGEKIDLNNPDLQYCEFFDIEAGKTYAIKAYSKVMNRNIKIVLHYPKSEGYKIYFSTNLDMSAEDIIEYYRTWFQIESCFRDSKQFTGLNDCQARDLKKLDFAFNTSLASVSIAKVMRQ